eukprot:CAMPEP_0197562566 /NCGR_PEP_ID=MMETSP1320-20131121/27152_1 /TAXON_ID=91990 /ORGANISM="Bolidomonas sp., Strain RCC2347" /LENGTH=45 /DNA_ID= /DNA_START= /DNA_END= /DNA_ORIENTATION=
MGGAYPVTLEAAVQAVYLGPSPRACSSRSLSSAGTSTSSPLPPTV